MTNYDQLIKVLKELFQLNQAELDFGIYRILNHKRDEISSFLERQLIPQVQSIIAQSNLGDSASINAELDKLTNTLKSAGVDPSSSPKVQELQAQIKAAPDPAALENEIFSHLAAFFKRYYKDGDFISMRRYKKDVYAIPYEGEEVKLYWANHDQYYIKTAEHLKNYAFKLPHDRLVRFELAEANTEKDNRKEESGKERRFRIYAPKPVETDGNTLRVFFSYEPSDKKEKQEDLNAAALAVVKKHLPADWAADVLQKAPTDKNKDRSLLEKHINDFTARNTFDYFIHKDLGGFLSRELDFYIKNEVLHLDDVHPDEPAELRRQLVKIRALREVGGKIIAFLAQLENFQKKLWLKKKFVTDTQYCITLDRIPEVFYAEIAANDAQRQEWVRLFAIDDIQPDLVQPPYSVPLSMDFLQSQPFLVLDTAFFSEDFKLRLIAAFDDLDEQLDGLLINSENFQALNLLQERYREQVKCVYIDPPYNADATSILYKNEFRHSSWLCFIYDRAFLSKKCLSKSGIFCATIDDYEYPHLQILLSKTWGDENNLSTAVIRNNPSGRSTVNGFSINHEYALFYSNGPEYILGRLPHSEEQLARYDQKDETDSKAYEWENFRKSSAGSNRADRPKQFYPIFFNTKNETLRVPELTWINNNNSWKYQIDLTDEEVELLPINKNGIEKVWLWGVDRTISSFKELKVVLTKDGYEIYKKKYLNEEGILPRTWWDKAAYSARDNGSAAISNIFGNKSAFDFPKSVFAVEDTLKIQSLNDGDIALDYFAGSGTTGHAVINLNREDGGRRKYILVEMGQYFDTVTKPRIQKVVYSADWKDGKPVGRKGSSHAFKYLRLESYEDALNNLQLRRSAEQQQLLELGGRFAEEYLLHYWLDTESAGSLLSVAAFERPFDYRLRIIREHEALPTRIDLVETFNYLIGLRVESSQRIRGFHVVSGQNLAGERILVIWRNTDEQDNAALDAFFQKQGYNTRDREYDRIYVNGDNNLENLKTGDEQWKVALIEEEFMKNMFDVKDI